MKLCVDERLKSLINWDDEAARNAVLNDIGERSLWMKKKKMKIWEFYKYLDDTMKAFPPDIGDTKISCGSVKHCNGCCYMNVGIGDAEAKYLSGEVKETKESLLKDATSQNDKRWKLKRPCTFLDKNGKCGVYHKRPIECRLYLVISDPSSCSAELNTKIAMTSDYHHLIVTSAWRTYKKEYRLLPMELALPKFMSKLSIVPG